jgi:(1->4)-alpha-D-glucan 1-alpha-D-glucosylmutase
MAELRATYRLQLTPEFGFADAAALVPYLQDLGISHLYLSPSYQARPGSTHGYDVTDPGRLSDALGGEDEFRRLAGAAREAGMGIVLDVVPNHMAADERNRYWADPALREQFFDLDAVTGRHRRFFDIDDLAAVRQEDPEVFAVTHELVLRLVAEGLVDGLRIDHPDGLADPAGYLQRLREGGAQNVWVEKILDPGEQLRDWPVSGTVGYEFLNDVCALFVDPAAQAPLTALWKEVSGDERPFGEVALEAKLEQVTGTFAPEVERLQREWPDGAEDRGALEHALASLPVYRTYVDPVAGRVDEQDRESLAGIDPKIARAVLLDDPAPAGFVTRFQQTTPAVMAKGVEDTAFYRYGRLLALNDVGGDPSRFGIGVPRFHQANVERAERFPLNLLTTQTHDAKRSGDVRARIAALSWMAEEWAAHVGRWLAFVPGEAPDPIERYFVLQTLAGAWPIEVERLQEYMVKALREAKRNTNWVSPDEEWERATTQYCASLTSERTFIQEFEPFVGKVSAAGERIAHGQLVLKLTVPGVPDVYQGDELPFRALVDPDNRRPVDWDRRRRALAQLDRSPHDGLGKLGIIRTLLALRARRPRAFAGSYEPVQDGETTCAFVRGGEVFVAVQTRPDGAAPEPPTGPWREVVRGDGILVLERN